MDGKIKLFKVLSPMLEDKNNHCFACGRDNPHGLRIKGFMVEENWIYCDLSLNDDYTGFPGIIHGGIQSTILDEVMAWAIFVFEKSMGITIDMQMKFIKPLGVCDKFRAKAKIKGKINNIVSMYSGIWVNDQVYTEGRANYLVLSQEKAEKIIKNPLGIDNYKVQLEELP